MPVISSPTGSHRQPFASALSPTAPSCLPRLLSRLGVALHPLALVYNASRFLPSLYVWQLLLLLLPLSSTMLMVMVTGSLLFRLLLAPRHPARRRYRVFHYHQRHKHYYRNRSRSRNRSRHRILLQNPVLLVEKRNPHRYRHLRESLQRSRCKRVRRHHRRLPHTRHRLLKHEVHFQPGVSSSRPLTPPTTTPCRRGHRAPTKHTAL